MRSVWISSLAALVLLAGGCDGATPFEGSAVELTITVEGGLSAQLALLQIEVAGAETDLLTLPISPAFTQTGTEQVLYRAQGSAGELDFTVRGLTPARDEVAIGRVSATLAPQTLVRVTAILSAVRPPDLSVLGDQGGPDLGAAGDLAVIPIAPSHVSPNTFIPGASPLSGVVAIDTTTLMITTNTGPGSDGGVSMAVPAGVSFQVDNGAAVLSTGEWRVDKEVKVSGTRPLVVVAAGPVWIDDLILASARGLSPGPGGSASGAGTGGGAQGATASGTAGTAEGGGGGAGMGTTGAKGGTGWASLFTLPTPTPSVSAAGGLGGAIHGDLVTSFTGGSGGGRGGGCASQNGGAGGGAVQISSGVGIYVGFRGGIHAGGGGGQAGSASCGGGGGGSGGTIFLEARELVVQGWLAANGGGGGGSAAGENAGLSPSAAMSGPGFFGFIFFPSFAIPSGGVEGFPPAPGKDGIIFLTSDTPGSGGGGAVGRIWLRTGANAPSTDGAALISPAAAVDDTLP